MIIWRGKGGLVVISLFAGVFLSSFLIGLLPFNSVNGGVVIIEGMFSTLIISGINYFLTKRFISDEVHTYLNEQTGERFQAKDRSSLFFIPNKYWTWIFLGFGTIATIASAFKL